MIYIAPSSGKNQGACQHKHDFPLQSDKLHLRHKRTTDKRLFACLSVCLSVVSARGVHLVDVRSAMLHRNLRGRE